jgi:hypothetical protein
MQHMGSVMFFLALAGISEGQSQERRSSMKRHLEEVQRQRAKNQRLMLDTAIDMAEALQGFATSQGDSGTTANLVRLAELGREIKVAGQNDDAMGAVKLVSEAGKIVALETAAKGKELAEAEASALARNATLTLFMNIVPAARMYGRFVLYSTTDAIWAQREAELKKQVNSSIAKPPMPRGARESSREASNQVPDLQGQNDSVSELDNAVLLCKWLDIGNRAFSTEPEQSAFYQRFPALDQCRAVAEYRSPAFEVQNWARVRVENVGRRTLWPQSSLASQPVLSTDSMETRSGTCGEEQQRTFEKDNDQCRKNCLEANQGFRSALTADCMTACVRDNCPLERFRPGSSR